MISEISLIGNPNCGKTSLFNILTATYQKVGNWSGVTTTKKEGKLKTDKKIKVVDLPGIYSFNTTSIDEKVVTEYLKTNKPSVIVNVVDGTNLERNLFLTSLLVKLNVPMLIAVNFCDDLSKSNIKINIEYIKKFFGVEAIEISAKKNINIDKLINRCYVAKNPEDSLITRSIDNNDIKKLIADNIGKMISDTNIKSVKITDKIDSIITNKFFALPIFAVIMFFIYSFTSFFGGFLSDKINNLFGRFNTNLEIAMNNANFPNWFISLAVSGVFKGIGSVLSFTPQILILFFLLTIIEESGYATRITFIMDKLVRSFGLSGKSVIPIMLSCGCTVNGFMASRTIENKSERIATVFLTSFMPCGAKTAVFAWFSYTFFNGSPFVSVSLYFISVFCVVFFGSIINKLKMFSVENDYFLLEMPSLRLPSLKNIINVLWEKTKDFVYKSGTIIFAVSTIVWMLTNFGINGYTENIKESFLYYVGDFVKIIFKPLGFDDWRASIAVICSVFAKEAVIEIFDLLGAENLFIFNNVFTAYSFMTFVLLSPPCVASLVSAKRELGSLKLFIFMIAFQLACAYVVALVIALAGKILSLKFNLILSVVLAIIILFIAIKIFIGSFKRKKFCMCDKNMCGSNKCRVISKRNTTL